MNPANLLTKVMGPIQTLNERRLAGILAISNEKLQHPGDDIQTLMRDFKEAEEQKLKEEEEGKED